MKILMISRDAGIVQEGSDVQKRMVEYGALADELHIVVFVKQLTTHNSQLTTRKISGNVWVYPTNSRNKWFYIYDAYKIAAGVIRNLKFEIRNSVITVQDPFETGIVGWLIARKHRVPLQLQIHTDLFNPYFASESVLNKVRVRIAKFLIPRAASIRVVSERIKNSLLKVISHKSKVVVLPIFVDVQKIKAAPIKIDLRKKYPQFDFIMLMASRFTKEKNIPMALVAMKSVLKKHPNAGLVIVGVGPEKNQYETLIANQRLEGNVVFETWTDDLSSYYKTADVFVLSSNYEGYGRTIIEAEAAGCPVIMTDVGIAGEIIKHGENGLIVPVGDAQALADAIGSVIEKKVLLTASLPTQPSKEAYLEAYKRTWEQCVF